PLGLVVVDYVQLVEVDRARDTRERVTAASDACKSLALDLGVPVLALSQLNRGVESRDPPVPIISDMRETGRLEEDADIVCLLYRPDYYIARDLEAAERSGASVAARADLEADLARARGRLDLIVAKQRSGAIGTERAFLRADLCHVSDQQMDAAEPAQGGML
ncbi:MAG: DnaB-like helicase C-terminal domain-containing protein, partial [Erythrobacter sp.]